MNLLTNILAMIIVIEVTVLLVLKLKQPRFKVSRGSMLLDTSAIMDGRIVDIARTGIITAELIVPRSVIRELQLLADKADHDKRMRARRGLENVRDLQKLETVGVTVINDGYVDSGGVDERLLELAKRYEALIATTDYNLNKVAKVVGITVVNVNELAQLLRAQHLPGELFDIELIQAGANRDQAVGYLADGTMVVVENAKNQIGKTIAVEVVRNLQTEAGRMMFAKPRENALRASSHNNAHHSNAVAKSSQRQSREKNGKNDRSSTRLHHNNAQSVEATQDSANTVVKQRPTSRRSRRPDHEDELIKLVNKQ